MATMYDPKKTYTAPSAPRVVNDSDAGVARISQQAPPARGQEGYDPYGGLQGGGAGGYSPTQIQDSSQINQATGYEAPTYAGGQVGGTGLSGTAGGWADWREANQAAGEYTDNTQQSISVGNIDGTAGEGGGYFDEGGEGAGGASDEILAKLMEYIGGYEEDRDLINRQMDERLAGGMRAMGGQLGASGFGASGAGVSLAGDVARQNEMARQQALRDSDEAFYQRLLGGHGAMLGERGMIMEEDYYGMLQDMIRDQLDTDEEGDPGEDVGSPHNIYDPYQGDAPPTARGTYFDAGSSAANALVGTMGWAGLDAPVTEYKDLPEDAEVGMFNGQPMVGAPDRNGFAWVRFVTPDGKSYMTRMHISDLQKL